MLIKVEQIKQGNTSLFWKGTEHLLYEIKHKDIIAWLVADQVAQFGGVHYMGIYKGTEIGHTEDNSGSGKFRNIPMRGIK